MSVQSLQIMNMSEKEAIWTQRIRECRESGMRVQDWCGANGLSYHTYYKWQQKLYHKYIEHKPQFYEINPMVASAHPVLTIHAGSYLVDVNAGADEYTIRSVLEALKKC